MDYLTLEDLLKLARDLGVVPVRDIGLLHSAAARPAAQLWGQPAYRSIEEKAAALLESVVRNHSLVDGNKRLGWLSVVVFYQINNMSLQADDDDVYNTVIALASGELSYTQLVEKLHQWQQPYPTGTSQ